MANNYLTPGIYVQEISTLPGVVVEVQSAIPAFIGYTEKIRYDGRNLLGVPEHINSFGKREHSGEQGKRQGFPETGGTGFEHGLISK